MSVAPKPVKKVLRTVTPPYRSRPDAEMTTIGWLVFLVLLVLLVPLAPFIVALWAVTKVSDYVSDQTNSDATE
ncbi:DUF7535 family protein [Halobacterium zhouii]|uniref:DUF7535 family protein n=1 Tax=Halobacterium zhouii TaxID=2902624 RepID=UPI001E4D762C|nr:hypothetical protein [Halobacterium zhouii]